MAQKDHPEDESASESADTDVLMGEALALLRVPSKERDTAAGWIRGVAKTFKANRTKQGSAPRLSHIKKRLEKSVEQANELIDFLESDLPYARMVASGYDLEAPRLPGLMGYDPKPLQTGLAELTSFLKPLLKPWPDDSGGSPNLFRMFHGSPKLVLAVECWELFTWFRPGKATGSETGDYHRFIEDLYALATGKEPNEDGAGLIRYTKLVAKLCNAFAADNPMFESVRRALAPGSSPVGLIGASMVGQGIFKVPTDLYDRLTDASIEAEHGDSLDDPTHGLIAELSHRLGAGQTRRGK